MILYDYDKQTPYSFDFDLWFSRLSDNSPFFMNWYNILQTSYHMKSQPKDGTFFQYSINLQDQFFLLHFNIEHICSIPYKYSNIHKIALKSIGSYGDDSTYIYGPTTNNNFFHLLTPKPIRLCPIPSDYGLKYVVIDGQHRVTTKKIFQIKNVNALIYIPDSENDFIIPFEYNMYQFLYSLYQKLSL